MNEWKKRYAKKYSEWQLITYPSGSKDHGTLPPNYPKVATSNGLMRAICDYLKWEGWRATRINNIGRTINIREVGKGAYGGLGGTFNETKHIHSATRNGTADISATIKGRSVMLEIKIAPDKPRESQLREQELERKAGGIYEFIYSMDEFFELYDKVINNQI